jgi:hypothetical protein
MAIRILPGARVCRVPRFCAHASSGPEIEAFLQLNITNARTEGSNRTIKQFKRVGCGFANQTNYERRILAYAIARDAA